jgi:hypothetical protein
VINSNSLAERWWRALDTWVWDALRGSPIARTLWDHLTTLFGLAGGLTWGSLLIGATFALPLGYLARTIARARIRSGRGDPLDRVRGFAARRTTLASWLEATPALLWFSYLLWLVLRHWSDNFRELGEKLLIAAEASVAAMVASAVVLAVTRKAIAALLAPTLEPSDATANAAPEKTDIVFDAIAVTRETRAAVGGMAVVSATVSATVCMLPISTLAHDPRAIAGLAAYVALALGGAALFRRASRIAIGVDGVLVTGTSKTRFFAYRDIDDARVDRGDIIFVRGIREVLRLQLHGEDAARRDAIAARISAAIARAREGRGAAPAQIVAQSTAFRLARAAQGGADYREPALTREQLWALVEGPEIDGDARREAAAAIAATGDDKERARLRVAAAQCAEPHVRVAIQTIATDDPIDEADGSARERRLAYLPKR